MPPLPPRASSSPARAGSPRRGPTVSRRVRASTSRSRSPVAARKTRFRSATESTLPLRPPSSNGGARPETPKAWPQSVSAAETSPCARQPSTAAAYMAARPPPPPGPVGPSRSKSSKTEAALAASRAFTQHVTKHDQTMRVGATSWSSRISRVTRWTAKSKRPARARSFTRMEKVTLLGLTFLRLMSAKSFKPNCKSLAFAQPSSKELYTISSHSRRRAPSSSTRRMALSNSPLLQ
mmetsp:Transcript_136643/g.291880  ORF Transcript_136643/g.291880 Transcript_136643/m.291880 type:complete len:236 (-) Transcript_136643:974-1681(-)